MKTRRTLTSLLLSLPFAVAALGWDAPPDDNFIYDSVREKLASDAVVKGGAIDVDVKAGVVTLKGKVQDQKQKTRAESLAKKVKGVKSVINNITISPL
jgi:hyperosmotically inducible protein